MADFLSTLKSQALLADGAMGSYLFELTGRLSEANHVYEAFNLEQPELIERVHLAYLSAGARCLKTNTFGANRQQLAALGLEQRLAAINQAGVLLARNAITRFRATHPGSEDCFVLASIGPALGPQATGAALADCYTAQLESLAAAGSDAILLETFHSLSHLEAVIGLIRSFSGMPPVIAELTLRGTGAGEGAVPDPITFIHRMAELGVEVAGVNCCAPWDAGEFVDAVMESAPVRDGAVQLVVMPNAGGFQRIGNRFMTLVNPEFAGKMARSLADRGVRLLGGCCEMHPPHIREMHNYLQSRQGSGHAVSVPLSATLSPAGEPEKSPNGRFSSKLKAGQFVVSLEMLPPRGSDASILHKKIDAIASLADSGLVDAVDFTDGSRGIPLMPPGDFIHCIRERLGWTAVTGDALELIPHFTGRDLNVIGVQSRLIGYHANRIHNVIFITGDPPKMSPTYPRSTAVFDLDSIAMIRLTHACLNSGVDFGGVPLGKHADPRTHFTLGSGIETEAQNIPRELDRLQQKIDSGVDYLMTQPAFHHEPLKLLEPFRSQTPILIGVMVLTGLDHARRMAQVPGVVIPDALLQRFAALPQPADQALLGQEIAAEQIRRLRNEGWAGVYLMSSAGASSTLAMLRAGLH
jgi:homocysteine S-methyltransferase